MSRSFVLLLLLSFMLGAGEAAAQAKKPAAPAKFPTAKDPSITVTVFMKGPAKEELLLATRIWPNTPDYNAAALQRYFALMKMLEPDYQQDDQVAYTWGNKGKVAKCSIYLEAFDAGVKTGTGAIVGCEANGVSSVAVPSVADPKHPPSASSDAKHLSDVVDLYKKSVERAKASAGK